jgi:two-component sensor histidine kinase
MDHDIRNSLEAISSLIYLIRHSLYDPAKTLTYVELAKERLKAIAQHTICAAQPEWTSQQEHLWQVGVGEEQPLGFA